MRKNKLLYLALLILALALLYSPLGQVAADYITAVYFDSGGDRIVIASGGEAEFRNGAALEMQSGSSADFQNGVAFGIDDITESTPGHGTEIESVLLRDGGVAATAGVTGTTGAFSDDMTMSAVGSIGTFARLVPQTAITVTNGGTITPTGSFQLLTAAGAVGTSDIVTTTMTAGDVLILLNTSSNTITISDTAPLYLSGDQALGENDTLALIYRSGGWYSWPSDN